MKPVISESLGPVNIVEVGYKGPLKTHEIIHRVIKEYDPLIVPGYEPSGVPQGSLYAIRDDLTFYKDYTSMTQAANELKPDNWTVRTTLNYIRYATNRNALVATSIGPLYFVENPSTNRFKENQKGMYPCKLHDLKLNTTQTFEGLKPVLHHLQGFVYYKNNKQYTVKYDRLKTAYKTGKIIFERYKVTPINK